MQENSLQEIKNDFQKIAFIGSILRTGSKLGLKAIRNPMKALTVGFTGMQIGEGTQKAVNNATLTHVGIPTSTGTTF